MSDRESESESEPGSGTDADSPPTLVFDDDCGFCTWWAEYFDERTDVEIVGYTDLTPDLRERLPEHYEACSHFVTAEAVHSCGASIERALAYADERGQVSDAIGFLRNFEDYGRLREGGYRWVADNRDLWGRFLSKTPPVRRESRSASEPGSESESE